MTLLRYSLFLIGVLIVATSSAQQESLEPLHAQPERVRGVNKDGGADQVFLFQNNAQTLPIMDDFSVDRTRNLYATPADANVTLNNTYYALEVGGVHTPDMVFSLDTTFSTLLDTLTFFPDSIVTTITPLPSTTVTVFNLNVVPPTSFDTAAWPPYDQTIYLNGDTFVSGLTPDLVQDSLCVYDVAPDTRTYQQNGTFVPWILWEDDDVYVNGTYPIDPPTVGVATFDGLARTGYPYDFSPTAYGIADHLTSVPIDMAYSAADSIYLSFFHQPQGLSGDDQVQIQDSLVLEFYSPSNDEWRRRWRIEYSAMRPFEQVMIPIKELEYLQNGFQFRFLNYGSLAGALDHWHIDYVRLATNRTRSDTILVDVAYVYPENSLLNTYTSVPYRKFEQNPIGFMATQKDPLIKNLDVNDRFITFGMSADLKHGSCSLSFDTINGINTAGNASSAFPSAHPINSAPNNFVYGVCPGDSCALWQVKYNTQQTPDINLYNDTIAFCQEFSNYTSYDDGSAEAGYSLNVPGGKVAYEFDTFGGDSLRAVRMYFDPLFQDPSSGSFLITVWTSLNSEVIQHQNFSFSTPQFRQDGINHFVEYPLDSTIWVDGIYYVGFVQTTATKLNLGFDKNRDHSDKIFFNVGAGFNSTGFAGALMMRPVYVADKDPFTSVPELAPNSLLSLYPNPANDHLHFNANSGIGTNFNVQVFNALGESMLQRIVQEGSPLDVSRLQNGTYFVRVSDRNGEFFATAPFIIAR